MSAYNDFASKKREDIGDEVLLIRKQLGTSEHIDALRDGNGVYSGVCAMASASVEV
jgi:hypothetical protein